MSHNIAPGDLVLCIKQGTWFLTENGNPTTGPQAGAILTVKFVTDEGFLHFEGYRPKYKPDRFRRIDPYADITGFEERRRTIVTA